MLLAAVAELNLIGGGGMTLHDSHTLFLLPN